MTIKIIIKSYKQLSGEAEDFLMNKQFGEEWVQLAYDMCTADKETFVAAITRNHERMLALKDEIFNAIFHDSMTVWVVLIVSHKMWK